MTKLIQSSLASLANQPTAITTINNNAAAASAAMENTLSRDGTAPNQMGAPLDMNSHQIINLPAPSSLDSPARLVDVVSNPTIVIPGTGSSGHVVPFLDGNNTWSGDNYFHGRPWADVRAFGAVGNGSTDDSASIQAACDWVANHYGGGIVFIPPGNYHLRTGVVLNLGVNIFGSGPNSASVWADTDISVFTLNGFQSGIRDITIVGFNSFSGHHAAVQINSSAVEAMLFRCVVQFGQNCINNAAGDSVVMYTKCILSYGSALVYSTGGTWYERCKLDTPWPGATPGTNSLTLTAWAANTPYTAGAVATFGGFVIQCMSSGTSGSVFPGLPLYGVNQIDGTATWQTAAPTFSYAMILDSGSFSTSIHNCDFTGCYRGSILLEKTGAVEPQGTFIDQGTFSAILYGVDMQAASGVTITKSSFAVYSGVSNAAINIANANDVTISNNLMFQGNNAIAWSAGLNLNITGNQIHGFNGIAIDIASNQTHFNICNNQLGGSAIWGANNNTVNVSGTSDYYNICNNIVNGSATGVQDGGSGTHKLVQGNW